MARPFATVVLAALAGPVDPALRARLGPELHDHLCHLVLQRVLAWARRAGGGEPLRATRTSDLAELLNGHDGPVLLAAPDVPRLNDSHTAAARDDLDDGVLISTGLTGDGTPFLVALARPEPRLLSLVGAGRLALGATIAQCGGALGVLRPERRLASLADARAVHADPLAARELRDLLAVLH